MDFITKRNYSLIKQNPKVLLTSTKYQSHWYINIQNIQSKVEHSRQKKTLYGLLNFIIIGIRLKYSWNIVTKISFTQTPEFGKRSLLIQKILFTFGFIFEQITENKSELFIIIAIVFWKKKKKPFYLLLCTRDKKKTSLFQKWYTSRLLVDVPIWAVGLKKILDFSLLSYSIVIAFTRHSLHFAYFDVLDKIKTGSHEQEYSRHKWIV